MKSNITIKSNVYPHRIVPSVIDHDFNYQITGLPALNRFYNNMTKRGINNFFSQNQKKIYAFKEYTECTKEEQKFGLARLNDGSIVVSCRCEKASCIHFDECMNEPNAKRITRVKVNNDETDQDPDSFILPEMEFIKIDFNENKILEQAFDDDEGDEKIKEVHDKEKEFVSSINTVEYKPVETPDEIIKAPYGEKIFINAGPGTGKTYSIIERINYFTINHQDKINDILVLSFTNAAKRVVEQRIEDGIKNGTLNSSAKNIVISTLDSLATYFLFEMGFRDVIDFTGEEYNRTIQLFNEKIQDPRLKTKTRELFSGLSYLIIDEIQDTVNDRARMIINILGKITCPWLLAGDKCQAIFDYDQEGAENYFGSERFYTILEENITEGAKKYELMINKRQQESKDLEQFSKKLRQKILKKEPGTYFFILDEIYKFRTVCDVENFREYFEKYRTSNTKSAILCRSNYDAAKVSSILRQGGVAHDLLKGSNSGQLRPWIAEMFCAYKQSYITRDGFQILYDTKVTDKNDPWEYLFELLLDLSTKRNNENLNESEININSLINAFSKKADIPDDFFIHNTTDLAVSTIHKAKGREYDTVFLLKSNQVKNPGDDESRVWYVAATRARKNLYNLNKKQRGIYSHKISSGRPFGSTYAPLYRKNGRGGDIKNIVIGMPGDIDPLGFVDVNIFRNPMEIQQYISKNIRRNDKIEICLESTHYYIYHNTKKIGKLNDNIYYEFTEMLERVYNPGGSFIKKLFNIYVTDIVSIHYPKYDETRIPPDFRNTQIWLGIDIFGLADFDY